jgi:hypothetical protein
MKPAEGEKTKEGEGDPASEEGKEDEEKEQTEGETEEGKQTSEESKTDTGTSTQTKAEEKVRYTIVVLFILKELTSEVRAVILCIVKILLLINNHNTF